MLDNLISATSVTTNDAAAIFADGQALTNDKLTQPAAASAQDLGVQDASVAEFKQQLSKIVQRFTQNDTEAVTQTQPSNSLSDDDAQALAQQLFSYLQAQENNQNEMQNDIKLSESDIELIGTVLPMLSLEVQANIREKISLLKPIGIDEITPVRGGTTDAVEQGSFAQDEAQHNIEKIPNVAVDTKEQLSDAASSKYVAVAADQEQSISQDIAPANDKATGNAVANKQSLEGDVFAKQPVIPNDSIVQNPDNVSTTKEQQENIHIKKPLAAHANIDEPAGKLRAEASINSEDVSKAMRDVGEKQKSSQVITPVQADKLGTDVPVNEGQAIKTEELATGQKTAAESTHLSSKRAVAQEANAQAIIASAANNRTTQSVAQEDQAVPPLANKAEQDELSATIKSELKAILLSLSGADQQKLKQHINNQTTSEKVQTSPAQLLEQITNAQKEVFIDSDSLGQRSVLAQSFINTRQSNEPLRTFGQEEANHDADDSPLPFKGEATLDKPLSDKVITKGGEVVTPLNTNSSFENLIKQVEGQIKPLPSGAEQASVASVINTRLDAQEQVSTANQSNVAKTVSEQLQQKMPLHEQFAASNLKERIGLMANGGISQAVISLDPEELGAMSIRIVMQQDQMNVQFQVQNPAAKEMLEQAMGKLRDMLEEQGIALNQSDVEQQSQQDDDGQLSHQGERDEDALETEEEPITLVLHKQSSNGIDYYA